MSDRRQALAEAMEAARRRTLWLLSQTPDEFLRRRVHTFYSPIGWHFGHVGRIEEIWTGGRDSGDPRLGFLFEDRPDNPKDNRVNIPDRFGLEQYLSTTRERSLERLRLAPLDSDDPLLRDGYAWAFALQHECQHQETIAEMLQLIRKALGAEAMDLPSLRKPDPAEMVSLGGGEFLMGSQDPHDYDNEKDAHRVRVEPFGLGVHPVTAGEWATFIDDRGYSRPELWSKEGWQWRETEAAEAPEYWHRAGAGWAYFGPFGLRPVDALEPVSAISHHEAEAYARWAGGRLPTEAEWEFAAAREPGSLSSRRFPWGPEDPTDEHADFALNGNGPKPAGTHPRGASAAGLLDLAGGVWEWTSSPFLPYPGFQAFPYEGYSKDHMDGRHFVCRGGSWASAAPILRCSFRNWYVPGYRQGFLGLRLAASA